MDWEKNISIFKNLIDNKLLWLECIIRSADSNMSRVYPGSEEFAELFEVLTRAVKDQGRYNAVKDTFVGLMASNLPPEAIRRQMRSYLQTKGINDLLYLFEDLEDF